MNEATEKTDIGKIQCLLCSNEVALKPTELFSEIHCPHCDAVLWFRHRKVDAITILDVVPETKAESLDVMRVGETLLRMEASPKTVVNLDGVKFISSSFIAGLIACHRRVNAAEGRMTLCNVHPVVMEGFVGARLDRLFEICEDEQSALNSLVGGEIDQD